MPHSTLALCSLLAAPLAPLADNGAIAHALPLADELIVDGDLSDWPEHVPALPLDLLQESAPVPPEDLGITWRVAYDTYDESLYVGLSVRDQQHVTELAGERPTLADSCTLYVDARHDRRGSAPAVYRARGDSLEAVSTASSWDPSVRVPDDGAHAELGAELGAEPGVEVAVLRMAGTTTYEWRVPLGAALAPGRTLGFDLLVIDYDRDDMGQEGTWVCFGPFLGKNMQAGRLGDLLLVDPEEPLGTLRGRLGWSDGGGPFELGRTRVRVESAEREDRWLQVATGQSGEFELRLPAGRYELSLPYRVFGERFEHRAAGTRVQAKVAADTATDAEPLLLALEPEPSSSDEKGFLFRWDGVDPAPLEAWVEAWMRRLEVPGVSVGLVQGGRLVYARGFGVANALTEAPVTDTTLFEACSMTKPVFAYAALRLAERGVLDLDRPLAELLPFPEIAHDERYLAITARHVLSHRTGFPNWRRYNPDGKMNIAFDPGTDFKYSGEAFEYLGRVVAQLTGEPLEAVLRREALEPLGVDGATGGARFAPTDETRARQAVGHATNQPRYDNTPADLGVAHSMLTEAHTYGQLVAGLLRREGLSEATWSDALDWHTREELPPETVPNWPRGFGLGFQLWTTPRGPAFGHGGDNGDFKAHFEAYPEAGAGWVAFVNADTGETFIHALRRFLVGGE